MGPGLLLGVALAGSVDPALVERRVAEIASLRQLRLATDAPPAPAEAYAAAARGEVYTTLEAVPGHRARKVLGVAVVDAPIGRLWAAVNDERSKVAWTRLGYLEILEGENCRDQRLVLQYLPVSLLTDRWWVVRQSMNDALMRASAGRVREVRWASEDHEPTTPTAREWTSRGMPVAYTRGAWFLVDLDGAHTLIEYYTWSDPGGSVPAGIASSFAAGGIASTFEAMAGLAAHGPRCPVE